MTGPSRQAVSMIPLSSSPLQNAAPLLTWPVLLFGGLVLLSLVHALRLHRRGDRPGPGLVLAAGAGALFLLVSPYVADAVRWWTVGLLVPLAAILILKNRHSTWRPVWVVMGLLFVLAAILLSSPSTDPLAFEVFFPRAVAFHLVGTLAWLVVKVVLPRTRGKQQATRVAGLLVILSLVLLVIAAGARLEAVDRYALQNAPVLRTGAEIAEQLSGSRGARYLGVFAVGRIGDPAKRGEEEEAEAEGYFAYYSERGPGSVLSGSSMAYFPPTLTLTMADGATVEVQGIASSRFAHGWPEGGPLPSQRALRHGDSVVVWADPGELASAGDGVRAIGLVATRLIAGGDFAEFQDGFLDAHIETSRFCGWIALALLPLAAIPLGFGVKQLLRHRSSPSSIPPPP